MTIDNPIDTRQPGLGRLGPIAGLVFVASVIVSSILFGEIDAEPSDTAAQVAAEYLDPEQDIAAAAYVSMLGIAPLLVFLAHLRRRMLGRGATWEADTLVLGFVVLAGAMIVTTGVDLMGAVGAEHGHDIVAQAANDFGWNASLAFTPGLLAIGLAAAASGLGRRGLPRWLGVFGALVAFGSLMPWVGILIFLVWMLALTVTELIGQADVRR